jgi:hypothetical protein
MEAMEEADEARRADEANRLNGKRKLMTPESCGRAAPHQCGGGAMVNLSRS